MRYPVSMPSIGFREIWEVNKTLLRGWVSSKSPIVEEFESDFAKYMGVKHAVACSSGTTALTLAVRALGIGKGDEVIVPENTMIASAWAVMYTGAKPVFVDCDEEGNIDVERIEEKITVKTKAIMPVHVYGRPCFMSAIRRIAAKHNLKIIEDACEALGGSYGLLGGKLGTIGDVGCFSLFANKTLTSGEGGVLVTNDDEIAEKARWFRSMCFDKDHTFLHEDVGYNFRMTAMQAAVAKAQLARIDSFLEKREKIRGWYDSYLKAFTLPRPTGSVMWMYDCLVGSQEIRDQLMESLRRCGIETRLHFKPMSMQPCLKATNKVETLRATDFSRRGFYLPTHTSLSKHDVELICYTFLCLHEKIESNISRR